MDSQQSKQQTQTNEENVTDSFSLEIDVPDVEIEYQDNNEEDCGSCKL